MGTSSSIGLSERFVTGRAAAWRGCYREPEAGPGSAAGRLIRVAKPLGTDRRRRVTELYQQPSSLLHERCRTADMDPRRSCGSRSDDGQHLRIDPPREAFPSGRRTARERVVHSHPSAADCFPSSSRYITSSIELGSLVRLRRLTAHTLSDSWRPDLHHAAGSIPLARVLRREYTRAAASSRSSAAVLAASARCASVLGAFVHSRYAARRTRTTCATPRRRSQGRRPRATARGRQCCVSAHFTHLYRSDVAALG